MLTSLKKRSFKAAALIIKAVVFLIIRALRPESRLR